MNTQLVTAPGRHDHPPDQVHTLVPHAVRRVGLLDRAALHLGVALIRWGRRPVGADLREQLTLNAETYQARREAERLRDRYQAMNLTRMR